MEEKILWIIVSVIVSALLQYIGKHLKQNSNYIVFIYFYKIFIHASISLIVYSGFKEYSVMILNNRIISDIWLIVGISCINILILLYNLGEKKFVFSKISQFDKKIIEVTNKDGIQLKVLKNKGEKIELTWHSFGKGIEILRKQIQNMKNFDPELYYGINEAGMIIASYLSSEGKSLGIIKTKGNPKGPRKDIQFTTPIEVIDNLRNNEDDITIILCDSEIKSGKSLKKYKEKILEYFEDNQVARQRVLIHIAVLCGVDLDNNCHIKSISNNYFGNKVDDEYSADFIAFYSNIHGFDPPGRIK